MRTIWILTITFTMLGLLSILPQQVAAQPDLYISEFSLDPDPPTVGRRVLVRIGVYNRGTTHSGDFTLEWWPGSRYKKPGCTWRVHKLNAKGGKIFTCTYFYPSWYAEIETLAVADGENEVKEQNENNNMKTKRIRVLKP